MLQSPNALLRIAIIGPSRFGIAEPYAGGLEAHTATLARSLHRLGHTVSVFAGGENDARPIDLTVHPIPGDDLDFEGADRLDIAMVPGRWQSDHRGYLEVLCDVADGRYDVVHNNSLHYLPVAMATDCFAPTVHTLHCPPFPELLDAHRWLHSRKAGRSVVAAVSRDLCTYWDGMVDEVVLNGIPTEGWAMGSGGTGCVWAGRLVPEKAPHLAIDAARLAGRSITLAGPAQHESYFDTYLKPRLGEDAEWVGHLTDLELCDLYGSAAVGVVTPIWDEPFGLVAAEMLSCGTPVAGFARGGLAEVLNGPGAISVPGGNVNKLATAINKAATVPRSAARAHAVKRFDSHTMAQHYESLYRRLLARATDRRELSVS